MVKSKVNLRVNLNRDDGTGPKSRSIDQPTPVSIEELPNVFM